MAHILIIEDDSGINSMLRDALGNSGYTCAFSGTEGLLLLEREHQSPAVQITVGELTLEPALHRITVCGKEPSLTAREYRILELLMKNPTKIFSKQEIYESARGSYYMGEDKTINVHISNIRQKLRRYTEQEYIETVWGIGFRMTQA